MKSFEKYIKNNASSFEMEPLPDSFDKVMEALEKKKKRRFIFWLWIIIPGIVLGVTGIFISQHYLSIQTKYTANALGNLHQGAVISQLDEKEDPIKSYSQTITTNVYNTTSIVSNNKENSHASTAKVTNEVINKNTQSIGNLITNNLSMVSSTHKMEAPVIIKTTMDRNIREKELLVLPSKTRFNLMEPAPNASFLKLKAINIPNFIKPISTNNFSRWSLGIYTQIGASKSIFINNNDSSGTGYANIRTSTDQFLFSYSAGLNVRYSPVQFLAIETGIGFTHFESNQIVTNGGAASLSIQEFADLDTAITLLSSNGNSKEYHNIYDYITIPLKVYYQKKWKWTGMEVGAGVVFDIPVNTSSYTADENTGLSYLRKDIQDARLNMFGVQGSLNLHMVFHAKKFSFFAGPVFKYRFNSMFNEDYIIKQHNYFIGAEIGGRYNF
jgi:hypothetical protein